jgi:hypothetical protein
MSASNSIEAFKGAADALYEGDSSKAATLFAAGAAGAVDMEQVARVIEQRAAQKTAVNKLIDAYPIIATDIDMAIIADSYVDANLHNGLSLETAVAKAGEDLAEKFNLEDLSEKSNLGKHRKPEARVRSRESVQPLAEEDPSAVIAELARSRPGNRD